MTFFITGKQTFMWLWGYQDVGIFNETVLLCPRSQRKQQKDLLAALQKVVVPIYATSFLAVEEEKQQKITRVKDLLVLNSPLDDYLQQFSNTVNKLVNVKSFIIPTHLLSCCSSGRRTGTLMRKPFSSYRTRPWASASTRWVEEDFRLFFHGGTRPMFLYS